MTDAPRILLHTDRADEASEVLATAHPDLAVETCTDYDSLPRLLAEHEPEVVYSVRFGRGAFPRDALMSSPSLRWISVGGSGTDHLQPWDPERLTVTNAAGVAAAMMAEYVLGTALGFTLKLRDFARAEQERRWAPAEVERLGGRTALIVGLGETGRAVAALLRAVGVKTIGVRANPRPTAGVDEVHGTEALEDLWGRADLVVLCVPLLSSTRGLVDSAAFAAMKPGALLINISRGGVVDETALLEALETGRLQGAAFDVFETEPLPPEDPLWTQGNLLITPHSSAVYPGWTRNSVEMFAENLARYRAGEALQNVVSPDRGY